MYLEVSCYGKRFQIFLYDVNIREETIGFFTQFFLSNPHQDFIPDERDSVPKNGFLDLQFWKCQVAV